MYKIHKLFQVRMYIMMDTHNYYMRTLHLSTPCLQCKACKAAM